MALRSTAPWAKFRVSDDGVPTKTTFEQRKVEGQLREVYAPLRSDPSKARLLREKHIQYLLTSLEGISDSYSSLDASQPWLCYWILNSLDLLDVPLSEDIKRRVVDKLSRCWSAAGGFGGGPSQLAHLAPTYAAVLALSIIGTPEAFEVIDRRALYRWLLERKQADGSFQMHEDGESDTRGSFCAIVVAKICNILTPELARGAAEHIGRCQSWDGGISAVPLTEAHGGYGFCGLAVACLLEKPDALNIESLTEWAVQRQMTLEGGFQGRTNKLVDGCYSFWVGGIFPLLRWVSQYRGLGNVSVFNTTALQDYVICACQEERGGLRDKPEKSRDFYHTCYCLAGLSVAQGEPGAVSTTDDPLVPFNAMYTMTQRTTDRALAYFAARGI